MANEFFEKTKKYNIHFTYNHKLQIKNIIKHLYIKYKKTINELLNSDNIKEILNNKNLNSVQKGEKIFQELHKLCYPELTEFNHKTKKLCDKIYNSTGIKVLLPQNFEGNFLIIQLKIQSYKQLIEKFEKLKNNPEIKKLLKLINTGE